MNPTDKICKYLTYKEATFSETALKKDIVNKPDAVQLANMKIVGSLCFDPMREYNEGPLGCNSFFRQKLLNKIIGSSDSSHHVFGMAIDVDADKYNGSKRNNAQLFIWALDNLKFTQIVYEYPDDNMLAAWIHIAYDKNNLTGKITIKKSGESYRNMKKEEIDLVRKRFCK